MKSTGIVRQIDSVGRLVLPIELRESLYMSKGDSVEIFVQGDKIILKKYNPTCVFCGEAEDVDYFKGKFICKNCKEELLK